MGVVGKEMRLKAKIAHKVYHKELYCHSVFKKTYAQYLDKVMQTLIYRQDCALKETCSVPELGSVQNYAKSYTNTSLPTLMLIFISKFHTIQRFIGIFLSPTRPEDF